MSVTAGKPGRRIAVVGSGRQCIFSMYTREIVRIVRSVGGNVLYWLTVPGSIWKRRMKKRGRQP